MCLLPVFKRQTRVRGAPNSKPKALIRMKETRQLYGQSIPSPKPQTPNPKPQTPLRVKERRQLWSGITPFPKALGPS